MREKKTVLVLGGSLGARRVNQLIAKELDWLLTQNVQIIWQCGKLYLEEYQQFSEKEGVQVLAFIDQNGFGICCCRFCDIKIGCFICVRIGNCGQTC